MSDLGLLTYYIRIEVKQGKSSITLCHSAYPQKLVEWDGKVQGMLEERFKLSKVSTVPKVNVTRCRSIVSKLRYIARPWVR